MTFIIAEIGVNWDGDFGLAEKMMSSAKHCGCDAVKFQAFSGELVKEHPQYKRLMNSSINHKNIETIHNISRSIGIEWFCTPMYPEAVEMLEPFVKRFKVRTIDGIHLLENKTTELTNKIIKTGKEMIVSSEKSPINCRFYGNQKIKWLYVVSKYPCTLSDLDFTKINDFDGFSNHCPYIIAPLASVILGCQIIEIHITVDKNKDFIDNNVSFDLEELSSLMNLIQQYKQIKNKSI